MSDALSLPLRILYNLNRSPQYILARSDKNHSVTILPHYTTPVFHYSSTLPVNEAEATARTEEPKYLYGSTSLKACLDTICCASPELMQDASRDYSVYVLDPLESQPVAGPVNIPADVHATSQQVGSQPGASASVNQPQPVAVGLGLMSWALLADERESVTVNGTVLKLGTGQEVLQVIFALREAFPIQKTALPDALRSWGLPPPPSKRSQVHASISHHSPSKSAKSSSNKKRSHSQTAPKQGARLNPLSRSERILDSANVYVGPPRRKAGRPCKSTDPSTSALTENTPNNDIHPPSNPATTSSIDPSVVEFLANLSSSAQNAALISVLSTIDGQNKDTPNLALVDALKQLLSAASPQSGSSPAPDTPNTLPQHSLSKLPSDDDIVILDKENVNPTAFRRRGDREDTKSSLRAPDMNRPGPLGNKQNTPPSINSNTSAILRKRRLSDIMDERDREFNGGRNRACDRVDAGPLVNHHSSPTPSHLASSWREASSIFRQVPSDENAAPSADVAGPATSPIRPPRRHGIPEWARTTTAMQPRFPKETEEYLNEKAAESKRKKKEPRRERWGTGRRASDVGPRPPKVTLKAPTSAPLHASQSLGAKQQTGPKVVAAAPTHLPVFASDLLLPSSSPPPSSPVRPFPKTPTRHGIQHSPRSYNGTPEHCSLFTPTPKSWVSNPSNQLSGLVGNRSPLSSPHFLSGRGKRAEKSGTRQRDGDETGDEQDVSGEEIPPSSLPIASSDAEIDLALDDQEMTDGESDLQHWAGLPPSSPPPPTSPILAPQDAAAESNSNDDTFVGGGSYPSEDETHDPIDITASFSDLGCDLADVLAQFSDSQTGDTGAPVGLHGVDVPTSEDGLVEFDFTEFWRSMGPLVGPCSPSGGQIDGLSGSQAVGDVSVMDDMGEIDHSKLAAEVQALFSGCLM